jgi:OTU domain-containing protein 5
MNDAIKTSEEHHIEKQMLDDKLKATDWEATNEEIMELVARESYLQWLKDNEKRQNNVSSMATCSTWDVNNYTAKSTSYQTLKIIKTPSPKTTTSKQQSTTLITTNTTSGLKSPLPPPQPPTSISNEQFKNNGIN